MDKRMRNKIITAARKHVYTEYFGESVYAVERVGKAEFEEREGEASVGIYCEVIDADTEGRERFLVACEFEQDSIGWVLATAETWDA